MGRRQDQQLQQERERLMIKIERPFTRAIVKEKNRYITAQSEAFRRSRILSDELLFQHTAELTKLFYLYYGRIIRLFIGQTQRELQELKFDLYTVIFADWISEFGADKVKDVARTTQNDIKRIILEASANEAPTTAIAKKILTAKGFSPWRSATIARTETHSAAMFASNKTATNISRELDIRVKKRWVPKLDTRTRDDHAAMVRHKPIDLDLDFIVGGVKMSRPGDPKGGASNVINCRCVLTYKRVSE